MSATPVGSKSRTFRVTTLMPWTAGGGSDRRVALRSRIGHVQTRAAAGDGTISRQVGSATFVRLACRAIYAIESLPRIAPLDAQDADYKLRRDVELPASWIEMHQFRNFFASHQEHNPKPFL